MKDKLEDIEELDIDELDLAVLELWGELTRLNGRLQ